MYSIVMLAAMTAAPETPDFGGLFGGWGHKSSYSCTGCTGCTGYTSCTGYSCSGYSSCTGYSCTGYSSCTGCSGGKLFHGGGLFHGCGGGLFHGHKSHSSCTGCCGGGYACHGVPTYYYQGCTGCTGCTGYSCGGGCMGCTGYSSYNVVTPAAPVYYPGVSALPTSGVEVGGVPATRAQVVVKVPAADAKLYVDGQSTSLTGAERTFLTPELTAGTDFKYTLKVEYLSNGETRTATRQVTVRAGQRTSVDLTTTETSLSASPVTVTMPEKAKLFVDDKMASVTGGRMTFRTPELTKGATYSYVFRAEVDVEGKTEVQTQKVVFKAGEPISVDFSELITATRTASAK